MLLFIDCVPKSMKPSPHDAVVPKRSGLPSSWGSMVMLRKSDSMLSVVNSEGSKQPRSVSQLCKASISETDPMHTPKSGIQSISLPSDLPSNRYLCSKSHYRERGCPGPRVYATPDLFQSRRNIVIDC